MYVRGHVTINTIKDEKLRLRNSKRERERERNVRYIYSTSLQVEFETRSSYYGSHSRIETHAQLSQNMLDLAGIPLFWHLRDQAMNSALQNSYSLGGTDPRD